MPSCPECQAVQRFVFRALRRVLGPRAPRHERVVCAVCEAEILPGERRYRLDEGAAHKDCYQRRADPA